jgi:hypothetical protein
LITLAQLDKAILTTAVLGLGSKPQSCYFASGQQRPATPVQPYAVAKPSENEPPEDDAKSQKTKVKIHQMLNEMKIVKVKTNSKPPHPNT